MYRRIKMISYQMILFHLLMSLTVSEVTIDDVVVQNDTTDEQEVFLTDQDFDSVDNFTEIDLRSIGINVSSDPTLSANKFEGDIVGFNSSTAQKYKNNSRYLLRSAVADPIKRWPRGEIPYTLSGKYGSYSKTIFAKVFREFAQKSCIKFIPKTSAHFDYIFISPIDGCYSMLGRVGGRQELSLDEGCIQFGTILHELMHVVGFFHEQSRTDRDEYVEIQWGNIELSNIGQFGKYSTMNSVNLPYDYDSIMHYDPYAFSRNGRKTIIARKYGGYRMGQREGFSDVDLQKLNKLYKCKRSLPTNEEDDEHSIVTTQSAEICEDKSYYCSLYASKGDCTSSRYFMLNYCAKTCNLCGSTNTEMTTRPSSSTTVRQQSTTTYQNLKCEDKSSICAKYRRMGHCQSAENYMKQICAETCGFCQQQISSITTTTSYNFVSAAGTSDSQCKNEIEYTCDLWAKLGECEKTKDFMRQRCAKACGFCASTTTLSTVPPYRPSIVMPTERCHDTAPWCRMWSQVGICHMDRSYMRKACAYSCGWCEPPERNDTYNDSGSVSTISTIETNLQSRRDFNKFTMVPDAIGTLSSYLCLDSDDNCQRWADAGYCNRTGFSDFVKRSCARSCEICATKIFN